MRLRATRISGTKRRGLLGFAASVLSLSPIMYHRMNEASGTSFVDLSGNGKTGTLRGTVTLGQDPLIGGNTASILQSLGGGMDAPDPFLGATYTGAWSNVIVFRKILPEASVFMGRGRDGSGNGWSMMGILAADGSLRVELVVGGAGYGAVSAAGAYTFGSVAMMTTTYEPGVGHKLYLGGSLIASSTYSSTGLRASTAGVSVGSGNNYSTATNFSFSDHAWFPTTLTPAQVSALYAAKDTP